MVVVTKPKVEILPIEVSGFVPVRDIAHFRQTAEGYWGATIYANHLVSSLVPLLPMISVSPRQLQPGSQSACNYMIVLMCRDEFRQAEDWVRDGPAPPPEIAAAVLAGVPSDLRQRDGDGEWGGGGDGVPGGSGRWLSDGCWVEESTCYGLSENDEVSAESGLKIIFEDVVLRATSRRQKIRFMRVCLEKQEKFKKSRS